MIVVPEHNRLYNSACDLTIGAAPKNTKSGVTPFHGYIDEVRHRTMLNKRSTHIFVHAKDNNFICVIHTL